MRQSIVGGTPKVGSPYPKSRRSDIRPRASVSPTDSEYAALLSLCGQDAPLPFDAWLASLGIPSVAKIGESSFSEVFRLGAGDESRAVKIMPLLRPCAESPLALDEYHAPEPVQLEHLLREVRALRALDALRAARRYAVPSGHTGFNRLRACAVVAGPYAAPLLDAWDAYAADGKTAGRTENDRPDHYGPGALHVALVMDFGGTDLEAWAEGASRPAALPVPACVHVRSVMLQLLAALSLAERCIAFEHRDLHLGNVLVRPTHRDDIRVEDYTSIPTAGLLVSVIDCSLSRFDTSLAAPSTSLSVAPVNGGVVPGDAQCVVFRDLRRDGWLFTGSAEVSRQYQLYRDMQTIAGDDWAGFHPRTNTAWIAYIAEEMLARGGRAMRNDPMHSRLLEAVRLVASSADSSEALRHAIRVTL